MSRQTLRRRSPVGSGLEADLAALRSPPAPVSVTHPPDQVDALTSQGHTFTFNAFTTVDAWELGHLLHARLVRDPRPALISISLANGGQTVFQSTTGSGVFPDNETWVQRKRDSVFRWGASTWFLHCKFGGDEDKFAAKYGLSKQQASAYAIHGGAVPIYVEGVEGVVAVVIVSGLQQHEDHGVIVDVVKENWEPVS